jgi:hypothetical protein
MQDIKRAEDWYNVTENDIRLNGGSGWLKRFASYYVLLCNKIIIDLDR